MPEKMPMLKNLRWGVLSGIAFATLTSLWVGGLAILRGSVRFETYGLTIWQIMAVYFAGGVAGGAVVGLLRPVTKYRLGAALVGLVAAVPLAFAVEIALQGSPSHWGDLEWGFIKFFACVMGPAGGLIRWYQTYGRDASRSDDPQRDPR
jgi:hypothetical protein